MTQHVDYLFHRGIPVPVWGAHETTPIYDALVLERATADPEGHDLVEAIHVRKRQQAARVFLTAPWLRGRG